MKFHIKYTLHNTILLTSTLFLSINLQSLDNVFQYIYPTQLTNLDCSYEAPDQCTGREPLSCCERLRQEEPLSPSSSPTPDGAGELAGSVTSMLVVLATAIASFY